mgnify:CR=1 FL=1
MVYSGISSDDYYYYLEALDVLHEGKAAALGVEGETVDAADEAAVLHRVLDGEVVVAQLAEGVDDDAEDDDDDFVMSDMVTKVLYIADHFQVTEHDDHHVDFKTTKAMIQGAVND